MSCRRCEPRRATTSDYSETKLVELTAEGGPKTAITVPGFLQGIARIR